MVNHSSDETNKDDNNNKKNKNKNNGNKHKRKPSGGIGNEKADCWKYFDPKMERPDGPNGPLVKMAHFVKDGLKVHPNEVETIGSRLRFLIAECPTRWNSTYDMLKSAIDLQDAFYNYSMKNASFSRDLNAIPRRIDFDVCQKVCDFLEKFKEKMELVSTQSSHVAHLFYSEILDIDKHLHEWEFVPKHLMENGCIPEENEDEVDTPMEFLTDNEKEEKVKELVYEVETNMGVLFALYNEKYGTKLTNNSSDVQKSSSTQSSNTTRRREPILELDDEEDFDILSWWKLNSPRFPIVSKMAKILVNLHYHQALLCTQSWVRTSQKNIYMDDLEDLMKDEEVIKEMKEALDKLKGANGKDATVTVTVTDTTEVATVAVMLLKWVLESRDVSGRSLVGIFKWVYREKNCEVFSVMSRWESCGSRRQKVVEKTAEDGRTSGSNRGGSDWDVKDVLSKLLQMGMVAEYQNSLEAKRSLDSNEEVKKAHTRVHGLEKQMEKLPIELQLDNNFREALETREPLAVPLEGLHIDDKLQFMEEPVEIMEREIKRLKRSRIPLVKVRWNSKRGPEFTWEREDSFKKKYPHLFTNRASSSTTMS
ncbi:zinc finger BED domain-containing protein RICESLEEPER 2 [Tanacetum coccineum]